MDYFTMAAAVVLAAKELTENEDYFFFYSAAALAGTMDTAYTKRPDMELDRETVGSLKDTLRIVTNAAQIVRSACHEIQST